MVRGGLGNRLPQGFHTVVERLVAHPLVQRWVEIDKHFLEDSEVFAQMLDGYRVLTYNRLKVKCAFKTEWSHRVYIVSFFVKDLKAERWFLYSSV